MIRFINTLLLVVAISSNLQAQNCKVRVRQDINPLNDSLCWIIGKENHSEFIVDKNTPSKAWIALHITYNPGRLSSMIGDSAWITLDNGYTIKLKNCKNFHSEKLTDKTLYVRVEHFVIRFLSEIKSEDIKAMTTHKITKVSLNLNAVFNLNYQISNIKERFVSRRVITYTLVDNHVAVRIKKAGYFFFRRRLVKAAKCAEQYIR